MDASNQLLEIEHSAMRLAAESYGYGPAALPEELRALKPSEAERALSPEKQRDEALNMLFDETYQNYKDEIRKNVSQSVEVLIGETHQQQRESSGRLLHLIHREEALIVGMLLLALLLILSTALLVSYPLRSYISHIRLDEELPEKGASELRFLARTYNQVREQNLRHSEQLRYDATHDALTGLFNRGVFEKLRSRLEGRDNALLIIDLDRFKEINDRYGHDIGDRALCCVSALLQENFRAEDYICRIGGDEFVVIMVNMNSSLRDLVEEKIRRINDTLKTPKDGLPPMSLSVGVAFGDRENPSGDIYKDADTALYRTKTQHRGGCEFY
jgi:diguanylate cyclase (GGDEF)-like protein